MTEPGGDDRVVELGIEPPHEPAPVARPTSRLHSIAIAATTTSGLIAVVAALAFLTVGWSGPSRRIVIAVLLFAIVGFVAGVSATVLGAARDTYARKSDN